MKCLRMVALTGALMTVCAFSTIALAADTAIPSNSAITDSAAGGTWTGNNTIGSAGNKSTSATGTTSATGNATDTLQSIVNGGGGGQSATNNSTTAKAYALFDPGDLNAKSPILEHLSDLAKTGVSNILNFVIAIFPAVIIFQFVVDILCMLVHPFACILSHTKYRVYSKECETITGVKHTGPKGANQQSTTDSGNGQKLPENTSPAWWYIKRRGLLDLGCGAILYACFTKQIFAVFAVFISLGTDVFNGIIYALNALATSLGL